MTCDACEAPAVAAFDRFGEDAPVGSVWAVEHFCDECLTCRLETQAGARE